VLVVIDITGKLVDSVAKLYVPAVIAIGTVDICNKQAACTNASVATCVVLSPAKVFVAASVPEGKVTEASKTVPFEYSICPALAPLVSVLPTVSTKGVTS